MRLGVRDWGLGTRAGDGRTIVMRSLSNGQAIVKGRTSCAPFMFGFILCGLAGSPVMVRADNIRPYVDVGEDSIFPLPSNRQWSSNS